MSCRKRRFRSEKAAQLAVQNADVQRALRGNEKRRETRSYYCAECVGWHLTSKPFRWWQSETEAAQ